jgi:hypothetical protein
MSVIQFRIHSVTEALDQYLLLDLFHLENYRSNIRTDSEKVPWYKAKNIQLEVETDFFPPIYADDVVAEFISDKRGDGFIVYLNHFVNKRSYAKANKWLKNIHEGHVELIREMGWDMHLFVGNRAQSWVSKKFLGHAKRLQISVIGNGYESLK